MIDVFDDFFTEAEHDFILDYCVYSPYFYGESDDCHLPPVGLVHNIWIADDDIPADKIPVEYRAYGSSAVDTILEPRKFYELFVDRIAEKFTNCTEDKLTRIYVNCFSPNDNPFFHRDVDEGCDATTFLYYPNLKWKPDDGGETQFAVDGSLYGVPPMPNRLVSFPSEMLHKATSFRDRYRFTVAIKYQFFDEADLCEEDMGDHEYE